MTALRKFSLDGIHPIDYLEERGVKRWKEVRIHLGQLGEAENGASSYKCSEI